MSFFADQHMHSNHSPDASDSVETLCRSAIEKGLQAVSVTDHCEANVYHKEGYDVSLLRSGEQTEEARRLFEGRLEVLRGVELGQATQSLESADAALRAREYDIVLASMHNLPGMQDFYFIDMNEQNPRELFGRYLDELLGLAEWGRFDVLAHLTYPLRYIEGTYHIKIELAPFTESIDAIYRRLIANGKGLEINTSGYRQPYGQAMPGLWCLRRYRELGGKIITFGADAHAGRDVGANLTDGIALAKKAGFESYAVYREHKPCFYPL